MLVKGVQLSRRCLSASNWITQYERLRLRRFKDCHVQQRRCFIIGNGPSIKRQDLTLLRNEITFVTNWFVLHTEYEKISPNYYCISDFREFDENYCASKIGRLLYERAGRATKFFPLSTRPGLRHSTFIGQDQIYYIKYGGNPIWELQRINLNPLDGTFSGDTVIIDFCLPLAHFMGFQEIILVGCDCTLGKFTGKSSSSRHFYNERDQNTPQQTDEYLQNQWQQNVFTSYRVAKDAFEATGRKIYNATAGGDLELFERVPLEFLF